MNNYISVEVFIENDISGDWGKEFPDEKHKTKVFCVRGADINDLNIGKIENLPVRYVKEASKDKFLEKGNIIIEISGGSPTQSTGRVAFLENIDREVVCSNFCRALKIKKEYSPKYVFYLLQNIYYSGVFFNFESKTSGIKNLLYNSAFENIKVPNRDYSSQQKIENVITVIDKKIQLLHQINDNLAELAKTIYDYWFVQFDFPDENGKPYKSSGGKMVYNNVLKREIPEGWEVKKLGDVAQFKNGINYEKTSSGSEKVKIINVRNISSSTIFINQTDLDEIFLENDRSTNFLVNDKMILITRSGVPGATRLVSVLEAKTVYSGFIIASEVNDLIFKNLIFYYLKNIEEVLKNQSAGTIMKNISQSVLTEMRISLPPQNVLLKFNTIIHSLLEQMKNVQKQNQELQSLRDWLLPMLMNGQISVE